MTMVMSAVPVVVIMVMVVPMVVVMVMVMQPLARPRAARVLAEDQRFDRHRHRVGRHADPAEIDIVEVHQHDAVDDEDFARRPRAPRAGGAERLRHVAVEHDVDRLSLRDAVGEAAPMPSAKAAMRS